MPAADPRSTDSRSSCRSNRCSQLIALGVSLAIAAATGAAMMAEWTDPRAVLVRLGRVPATAAAVVDPIFGRPLAFYLFTLPAWQLLSGWLMTLP